jgi:hypothetical protein
MMSAELLLNLCSNGANSIGGLFYRGVIRAAGGVGECLASCRRGGNEMVLTERDFNFLRRASARFNSAI